MAPPWLAFSIAYVAHCAALGLLLPVGAGADAIIVGVIVAVGVMVGGGVIGGGTVAVIVGPGFMATIVGDAVGVGSVPLVGGADAVAAEVAVGATVGLAVAVGLPLAPPPTATCVAVDVAAGVGLG